MTKTKMLIGLIATLVSSSAFAQGMYSFQGSQTLAGVISDAINEAGFSRVMRYDGGGSGKGEAGLVSGTQGFAPMSRPLNQQAIDRLAAIGVTPIEHRIGLDGLSMFVNIGNPAAALDMPTISAIYTCRITRWEDIPTAAGMRGPITPYRRDDASGTTSSFKDFTGVKDFGPCVVVAPGETIGERVAQDASGVAFAGHSAKNDGNRVVPVAKQPGADAVLPTDSTIRSFAYPMSRYLYIYEASGARVPSDLERQFLNYALDRDNMDRHLQAHDLTTLD